LVRQHGGLLSHVPHEGGCEVVIELPLERFE
jgi:hypothetical protein